MSTVDIDMDQNQLQATKKKLEKAADWMRSVWQQAVTGLVLPGMTAPVHNNDYAESLMHDRSISVQQRGDQYSIKIDTNYPHWREVEDPIYDDWKAVLLDPALAKTGNLRTIPAKTNKKGDIIDPGGFSRVIPLGGPEREVARGISDPVYTGDEMAESWTNFDANAEPSSISDPSGTATTLNPTTSLPRPDDTSTSRPVQSLTFRTVSTPRFDSKGRAIGSAPNSWMRRRPANPVVDAVKDYCEPKIREYLQSP